MSPAPITTNSADVRGEGDGTGRLRRGPGLGVNPPPPEAGGVGDMEPPAESGGDGGRDPPMESGGEGDSSSEAERTSVGGLGDSRLPSLVAVLLEEVRAKLTDDTPLRRPVTSNSIHVPA